MAPPSFINTGFAFTSLAGVVDVQTIMNAIATMLTTTLSGVATNVYPNGERWTNPVGTTYQSPADTQGRFMKVTVVRTTITRMEFKLEDPSGVLIDGEIDIAAGGSTVNIYGGPGHLTVEANNGGTFETAQGIITDPTPEPLASSTVYVWGRTFRNTAGTAIGNNNNSDTWAGRFRGGTVTGTSLYAAVARAKLPAQDNGSSHLRTEAGSDCAAPAYISTESANGTDDYLSCGKLYQHVLVDSNQVPGVDINIPIDTGVTGVFRVLSNLTVGMVRLAARKG